MQDWAVGFFKKRENNNVWELHAQSMSFAKKSDQHIGRKTDLKYRAWATQAEVKGEPELTRKVEKEN